VIAPHAAFAPALGPNESPPLLLAMLASSFERDDAAVMAVQATA
jgi:hypothetical protein